MGMHRFYKLTLFVGMMLYVLLVRYFVNWAVTGRADTVVTVDNVGDWLLVATNVAALMLIAYASWRGMRVQTIVLSGLVLLGAELLLNALAGWGDPSSKWLLGELRLYYAMGLPFAIWGDKLIDIVWRDVDRRKSIDGRMTIVTPRA